MCTSYQQSMHGITITKEGGVVVPLCILTNLYFKKGLRPIHAKNKLGFLIHYKVALFKIQLDYTPVV